MSKENKTIPRLRKRYTKEIVPALQKKFGIKNVMQIPRLEKVVLNMGVGRAIQEAKLLDEAVMCLKNISGQQPVITKAKNAISNFLISSMFTSRGQGQHNSVEHFSYKYDRYFDMAPDP